MNAEIKEIAAKLTLHEFLLEIIIANNLAHIPEHEADHFKSTITDRMSRPYGVLTGDTEAAQEIQDVVALTREHAGLFVQKLSRREAEIRRKFLDP